jgi:ribosomal protein S18 acetylase RimI-like enzyme
MTVEILRAGVPELPLARQAICDIHGRDLHGDEAIAAFLEEESRYLLLAVEGDEVVGSLNGYALTHPHRVEPQFLLYEIDVREGWRRRGVGKGLIDAFLGEARRLDAFAVWVVTDRGNDAAMALYRKCGFTTSDLNDVVFSREL